MTLAEQIKQVMEWDEHVITPASDIRLAKSIIRQLADIVRVQHEALATCRLFAGCEREYDEQRIESALALSAPIVKGVE